jgi:hypothetical protein
MSHPYAESRKRARKKWRKSEKGRAWDLAYSRHRLKGKREDILKAIHFLEMILERDYREIEKPKENLPKEKKNSWGIV